MKIGHICLTKDYGGSAQQLLMLAKALSHHDIEQCAVVRNRTLANRLSEHADISIGPLVNSPIMAYGLMPSIDLAHLHDHRSFQSGLLLAFTRSIPYVLTQRSLAPQPPHALTRSIYRRAERVACVSEAVAKSMIDFCPDTPIDSIYDACWTYRSRMPSRRDEVRNRGNEFVVGHVGELNDSTKGQAIILDIAEELVDRYPNIRFVLIGNGKDEDKFRERAAHLSNVSFTGWLPNLQVCYETMNVFVYPSRTEALGSAMLEAMTFHLPVIASNVGGIPEILRHGREGILCDSDDKRGFREALLALYGDRKLRARLGDAACARAREFTPERMAAGYVRVYQRALNSNQIPALLI